MSQKTLTAGLIAGAAIGTVAGLLFAPKPGKVTRRFVASRSGEIGNKVGGAAIYIRGKMRREENPEPVSTNGYID